MNRLVPFVLGFALVALGSPLAAQSAGDVPTATDAEVRALVASKWDVDAEAITLTWGVRAHEPRWAEASVSLVGRGAGGHWVVRFDDPDGGTVSLRVRAAHRAVVPVATRSIERGAELTSSDITYAEETHWGPPSARASVSPEGAVARRPISRGEALVPPTIREAFAVTTGSPVYVVVRSGAVRIRTAGTAAGSAALGGTVRVRTESGKRMTGVVVAPGTVDVTPVTPRTTPGGDQ